MSEGLEAELRTEAQNLGFAALGICAGDTIPNPSEKLARFLSADYHGTMAWMADRQSWRGNPRALWPEVRSIIMLAENYAPDEDPLVRLAATDRATISVYAGNRDYHDIIKKRLKRLGRWLIDKTGAEIKVFVDTAPVMEKPLAEAAGLGWQGKHTNLVSRDHGNWLFLGAIFTTAELSSDTTETDHCGSCRACLDICPTDAFPAPYRLDARRCISYLTIEHKGPVDIALRRKLGNRIYGCDDCLAVCPWNKFAILAADQRYHMRADLRAPRLANLATLTDEGFRATFSGSPVKRIGRARFLRNVAYAIGNSGNPSLLPVLTPLSNDPDPVLAEAASWAMSQLSDPE